MKWVCWRGLGCQGLGQGGGLPESEWIAGLVFWVSYIPVSGPISAFQLRLFFPVVMFPAASSIAEEGNIARRGKRKSSLTLIYNPSLFLFSLFPFISSICFICPLPSSFRSVFLTAPCSSLLRSFISDPRSHFLSLSLSQIPTVSSPILFALLKLCSCFIPPHLLISASPPLPPPLLVFLLFPPFLSHHFHLDISPHKSSLFDVVS